MSLLEIDYIIRDRIKDAQSKGLDSVTIPRAWISFQDRMILSKIPGLQVTDIWESADCNCNDSSPYARCICRRLYIGIKVAWEVCILE